MVGFDEPISSQIGKMRRRKSKKKKKGERKKNFEKGRDEKKVVGVLDFNNPTNLSIPTREERREGERRAGVKQRRNPKKKNHKKCGVPFFE